jgi:hypothetical protein
MIVNRTNSEDSDEVPKLLIMLILTEDIDRFIS